MIITDQLKTFLRKGHVFLLISYILSYVCRYLGRLHLFYLDRNCPLHNFFFLPFRLKLMFGLCFMSIAHKREKQNARTDFELFH